VADKVRRSAEKSNMNNPWQYDETIQVGTDYRDQAEVAGYDERMQKLRDIQEETRAVKAALSLSKDCTVWEIGTGTGECALALAPGVGHVYATDISPTMLRYAGHKAKQRGICNVTFKKGGFLSGFRPPCPVDGVVTQLALHHLPDFWKSRALAGIASRLRPAGKLYLRDVVFPSDINDSDVFFARLIEKIRRDAGDELARQTIQHIKKEFSTLDWILEGMMTRSGLRIIEKDCSGFLSVYVCEKCV